ncbi:bifunctional oligoribonuclease/PAP phosphatase NrnA [Marispirochaeta sp.]|uniref:DHH family phosphoesterase n=1 Tax=Marispirochaeta sp. TaxID=2038653 RepID=UPI0029C763AB|nr:bifunctional oligoribonuclease/PAP phosphatase NrnA [Marispirochaeta sp.]
MAFSQFKRLIDTYDIFFITCHETPDGDAIGAEIAMYHALTSIGKRVRIINADPVPDKYRYLYTAGTVELIQDLDEKPESDSVLLILDTNDIHNIGEVAESLLPHTAEYFIIDHHESGKDISSGRVIEASASSTCEILFKIMSELGIAISKEMAIALYTGIIYDTGCFVYPKTTAFTFSAAEKLVRAGANPNSLYTAIYESNSISSLKLQARVLSSLELHYDHHVAVLTMLRETIAAAGALYEEADTLINIPLQSEKIRVSVFFKENTEGLLRCSLRSKGNINVSRIAQKYGGGGHRTAAGFKSPCPLDQIHTLVLQDLAVHFPGTIA